MTKAIDIRTRVYCNRGPVISGSLEENTIVGAGLVNVTGSIILNGVYRVKEGDIIELAYYKNNRIARLGRKLRATSVYANPVTRTTEIALGCLLTYNKDNEPPPKIVNSDGDTSLPDLTEIQKAVMIKPISAKYIAEQICAELGIQHEEFPLTNQFYSEEFEISGPYLNVLSDLLVSENYVGYINSEERLNFVNLLGEDSYGAVLDEFKVIDIEPINAGDPPADIVYSNVTYKSIRLDASATGDTGETDEEILSRVGRADGRVTTQSYENNGTASRTFRWSSFDSLYKRIEGSEQESTVSWADTSNTSTDYELFESKTGSDSGSTGESSKSYRPVSATTYRGSAWGVTSSQTFYSYSSGDIKIVTKDDSSYDYLQTIVEACGFPAEVVEPSPYGLTHAGSKFADKSLSAPSVNFSGVRILTTRQVTITKSTEDWSETTTQRWASRVLTSDGAADVQQYIQYLEKRYPIRADFFAALKSRLKTIIDYAADFVPAGTSVSYSESAPKYEVSESQLNRRSQDDRRDDPKSGITYTIVDNPEIIYIKNTGTGINLELTPPYMSDDQIIFNGLYYEVVRSDAVEKATAFARTQNRLRYGYRNGQSIVYPIEYAPIAPFKPLYLSFGGVIGQFRSDRMNIAFDSSGILVSTDAIFWGGVGK